MHFGSGSCFGTEFEPGSNIKSNSKAKKHKLEANFQGNTAASSIKEA
jgi:hypothetical protein